MATELWRERKKKKLFTTFLTSDHFGFHTLAVFDFFFFSFLKKNKKCASQKGVRQDTIGQRASCFIKHAISQLADNTWRPLEGFLCLNQWKKLSDCEAHNNGRQLWNILMKNQTTDKKLFALITVLWFLFYFLQNYERFFYTIANQIDTSVIMHNQF